ncbi:hypothetical protein KIN20_003899 [Parelaphostrongylus tenuis]|uniref:Uncharacterized protein n=1 Tax=Parelaphostrongylus tenuis TaxID=148309 RepID=A0AAD5QEQ1_PARTN|nr:hypothetical protein KIN20_003899 [Parelaphostrongylus tenuis]
MTTSGCTHVVDCLTPFGPVNWFQICLGWYQHRTDTSIYTFGSLLWLVLMICVATSSLRARPIRKSKLKEYELLHTESNRQKDSRTRKTRGDGSTSSLGPSKSQMSNRRKGSSKTPSSYASSAATETNGSSAANTIRDSSVKGKVVSRSNKSLFTTKLVSTERQRIRLLYYRIV